ncbi:hypothetical protein GGI25_003192 [Coemansia spiralis]|uniref:Uncharacterized protein n=2 Tax=Coemansia TaxID=4863 RepID=A0A9W8G928_9FUNG|nr:hypothetical protein BX070DRAFT_225853 [Coemansia spiralis]KAJ1991831.1 hypothetical protein EDC05_003186 [Coemansia umbellata]KAJ2621882.1 hypothetical protein GGI26_003725 [Coemansia sp. RSA 1358]KAJ2677437.1 hypothetical protein GGI25_003192 [Coemansia spiralis]
MSDSSASTETETQRRRRLRQERIMNRGGDRLSRIKNTFSQVQEETSESEMTMAGGHELKTATEHSHTLSDPHNVDTGEDTKPRRRIGNLARKAKLETEDDSGDLRSSGGDPVPGSIRDRGKRRARAAAQDTDINSDALHDSVTEAIADPAVEAPCFLPSSSLAPSPSSSSSVAFSSLDESGVSSGILVPRQFSAIGLSRTIAKLLPVIGVYVYGIQREARYERLMGDSDDEVQAKWANLMTGRPDSRLDEWSNGSFLLWYLIILELAIYGAYFILADGRQSRPSRAIISQISGIPNWATGLLSVGSRVLDNLCILLFFTAVSILGA